MRSALRLHIACWLGVLVGWAPGRADATVSVPDHANSPPVFAVTPFENHVANGRALDWIATEAPFEIAEKTQDVLGLDPSGSPLFVPETPVPPEATLVAAFAGQRHADYVVTGWFDRVGDDLRIAVVIWRVEAKTGARVAGEAKSQGDMKTYHAILGNAVAEAWLRAGVAVDDAKRQRLGLPLSNDIYPVFTMARGLGYLVAKDLKNAEHDLERAVFLDPKLRAAQRLLGELYRRRGEPKDDARAAAKFNYALELAPDDLESLRAAAAVATKLEQWDRGLELWTAVVTRRPWDVDARFQLGRTQWQLGNVAAAEHQLDEVVSHRADHLDARHVLVLIHASRSDVKRLAAELELIAIRAPNDLDVKSDLASAYGALGRWDQAAAVLEALATARPKDVAVLVRAGDAQRKRGAIDAALRWYERAGRLAPATSMPGFLIAQAQFDAGRVSAATQTYANLRRYGDDVAPAEHALGVIAFTANRFDDAAAHFHRAARGEPRNLETRRALIAAELERNDHGAALRQLEPALREWPEDGVLHYLAGLASRLGGDHVRAQRELHRALAAKVPAARVALDAIDAGGSPGVTWRPSLVRPWGDTEALAGELDRFSAIRNEMALVRSTYQDDFVAVLGMLGKGPAAKRLGGRGCPTRRIAPRWSTAQKHLVHFQRLGVDLEASFQRIVRHDALGLTAALLPGARVAVAGVRRDYKLALQDATDLRAQWSRGLAPELAVAGCTVALLASASADPTSIAANDNEFVEPAPKQESPRSVPRATFFVDNTSCRESVDVYIDDNLLGRAAAGRRSAWVADGGDRSLCLILPGTGQCGDRGTVRRVYLHDGWTVTMRCHLPLQGGAS